MKPLAWKLLALFAPAAALVATAAGCSTAATGTTTHCTSQTPCGAGTDLTLCTDQDTNGVCVGMVYKVGSASFTCSSCLDCNQAQAQAVQACASGSGSGG